MAMSISTTSGIELLAGLDRLAPVGGLPHHLDVRGGDEQGAHAFAQDGVVVGDEDADLAHETTDCSPAAAPVEGAGSSGSGTLISRRVPFPGADSMRAVPPSSSARSLIPSSP